MNINPKNKKALEAALILHGLRAVYVADQEPLRQKLIKQYEGELSKYGFSLPER